MKRRLDKMISARFTPTDGDTICAAAQRAGLTMSEFVRRAALIAARPPDESAALAAAGITVSPVGGPWRLTWTAGQ